MEDRVIKVTRRGGVWLDGARVGLEELSRELCHLRELGGRAVYYREAPFSDPRPEVMEVVSTIIASKVSLATGEEVPSEWGSLQSFTLYEAPDRFRLQARRGADLSIWIGASAGRAARSLAVELPRNERLLHQLDLLIRSDRVLELPRHESELAFDEERVEQPSVHLRIEYMDRGPWTTHYAFDARPSQLVSLGEDCAQLARLILGEGD